MISEIAYLRVLVSARGLVRILRKYNPDQPRVPAGKPGGGQWTNGDTAQPLSGDLLDAPVDGSGPELQLITDETGDAPWSSITTIFDAGGEVAAQVVENRNGTTTSMEWDTGGVERWAVRQTIADDNNTPILSTEFNRDTSARFAFGAGAAGKFELTNDGGALGLASAAEQSGAGTGLYPEPGDRLALLGPGVAVAAESTTAGIAGPVTAIIVAGTTAFPTPAGADSIESLGPDLRLNQRDDGLPPRVETRDGGQWVPVDGAVRLSSDGETLLIDAGRLRSALGDDKVDAAVSALQERSRSTIVGERWSPETGATRDFTQADVEQACKMYPTYKATVEWAASAVDREGLSPSQYGTAVHTAVDHYFERHFPMFDPGTGTFDTERSMLKDTAKAYYSDARYGTTGSLRFDAYEDVGNGTVCGYDIKVGNAELTLTRIAQLRAAAVGFYRSNNSGMPPRDVIIMQVKPWR